MYPFDYTMPHQRIIKGADALGRLGEEAKALGISRIMAVYGVQVSNTRLLKTVRENLSERIVTTFADVRPHPDVDLVQRGAQIAREYGVDGFVSVGGGSASDTAKAINIVLAEGGEISQHASRFVPPDKVYSEELPHPKLPIIAVPTTCSGAEMTPGLGVRNDQGIKLLFWDVKLASRLVVLAPECLAETPVETLTTTAMNGLAHCFEGLYSRQRSPISDALALQGIRLFNLELPRLVDNHNDKDALAGVQVASALGGMVISNARVGIHHAICHCLGARLGIPHGVANSIILPYAMRFNLDAAKDQLALAAPALAVSSSDPLTTAEHVIDAVFALRRRIGTPENLRDAGVARSILTQVANDTLHDRGLYFNPKHVSDSQEVLKLLEEAW